MGKTTAKPSRTRTIPASEFKARCLALLDEVRESGGEVLVTKRGKPVARLVPVQEPTVPDLRGSVKIHGDIIGPFWEEWGDEHRPVDE